MITKEKATKNRRSLGNGSFYKETLELQIKHFKMFIETQIDRNTI